MVFTIPDGLHEELYPLAWLVGTWRGKGQGEYPSTSPFTFEQEVTFNHDGRPFLTYFSRSWLVEGESDNLIPSHQETGFWRVKPNNVLEVILAHNLGITEGWVGRFDVAKIQLVMDQGYSAPTAKVVTGGTRLYGLVEGELFYAYDMEAQGHQLQAHVWSTMERIVV